MFKPCLVSVFDLAEALLWKPRQIMRQSSPYLTPFSFQGTVLLRLTAREGKYLACFGQTLGITLGHMYSVCFLSFGEDITMW